jgi:large subunit ribosomal protein L29
MKNSQIREMTIDELRTKDDELKRELFNIQFQLHTGRLENTAKLPALRKDLARVKTILKEKRG